MPTNFAFLKTEWPEIEASARKAEKLANTDRGTDCFHARKTLEVAVDWMYEFDEDLTLPYSNELSAKIYAGDFKNNMPPGVFTKVNNIRKIGHQAVHSKKPITSTEDLQTVRELFHVLYWLARTYTTGDVKQFDRSAWDAAADKITVNFAFLAQEFGPSAETATSEETWERL